MENYGYSYPRTYFESISYAVIDLDTGKETIMVFTGVTLFVNDVGRIILYEANNAPNHQIQIASM